MVVVAAEKTPPNLPRAQTLNTPTFLSRSSSSRSMLWSSFAAASALASRFFSRRSTFLLMPTSFGLC